MLFRSGVAIAALLATSAAFVPAQASIYNNTFAVTVSEGVTTGVFDTYNGNPFAAATPGSNTAAAAFTFNGPLNFGSSLAGPNFTTSGDLNSTFGFSASNISGYTPACTVNCNVVTDTSSMTQAADFTSLTAFLGSSGSEAIMHYGSYYTFDLGVLAAGTTLVITHDDGVALYQGSTPLHQTTSGLTGAVTETVNVASSGDTILRYSRQNGTPSILQVNLVPEPMSIALMGVGLAGLGLMRRRRRS